MSESRFEESESLESTKFDAIFALRDLLYANPEHVVSTTSGKLKDKLSQWAVIMTSKGVPYRADLATTHYTDGSLVTGALSLRAISMEEFSRCNNRLYEYYRVLIATGLYNEAEADFDYLPNNLPVHERHDLKQIRHKLLSIQQIATIATMLRHSQVVDIEQARRLLDLEATVKSADVIRRMANMVIDKEMPYRED